MLHFMPCHLENITAMKEDFAFSYLSGRRGQYLEHTFHSGRLSAPRLSYKSNTLALAYRHFHAV
jgi:hypothetical protein